MDTYFYHWILGNLITIITGILSWMLLIMYPVNIEKNIIPFILLGPFFGGFIIKFIYQKLPISIYGTIGFIYEIGFLFFVFLCSFETRSSGEFFIISIITITLTIPVSIIAGKLSVAIKKLIVR